MGLQRALLTVALPFVLANNHVRDSTGETVIERDVAIIGGGASGTFAATRFKDSGISFVIIEEKSNVST
jgi:ribulose 1,5-bisphosphate synthetase/thiazole synthase